MAFLKKLVRFAVITVGVLCVLYGAVALGLHHLPDNDYVRKGGNLAASVGALALEPLGVVDDPRQAVRAQLQGVVVRYGALPLGLILMVAALLPGRSMGDFEASPDERGRSEPAIASKLLRKARKQAAALARKGELLQAADLCFVSGLSDEAVEYFVKAGQLVKAAEIRHDQNRFVDSADLYLQAGKPESAARILAQQEEWTRAGEAYVEAENQSVAAEMFEKAGDHERAAKCYEEAGFPRHAAQAYVKSSQWERAAVCLEQTIIEEGASSMGEGVAGAQIQKLVRMAGNLFERAGLDERAEAVLERGQCFGAAAEIAARSGRLEAAAELYQKAKDVPRAAEILQALGRGEEAALLRAEHHRDLGDDEESARQYESAGDLLGAGDLYRMLEQYERAGDCYDRHGDPAQAAEMFVLSGDLERATDCYERGGLYAEAAECMGDEGDPAKRAELLSKAGQYLRAGELLEASGKQDEAIAALQQVAPEHHDYTEASAILGDIFRERGQLSLAIAKLTEATQGAAVSADNVRAYYGLASAMESNGDVAEADALFEKILSFDYTFRDVQQCLDRTRQLLEARAEQEKAASASAASPTAGEGRYKIVGKLGRGGMGVVYKAVDTVLDRTVAFKVLPDALRENPQALKNFLREAKSAAKLNHPGIVTVFDAGEQDGVFYIAMEHVDGNTLKDIIKHRGVISPGGICHVVAQMCEALAYAHDKKVVHRDIKTANTMWTRDRKAKIMDFGLAKVIEEVRNHTTVVSGTPYYMSPEQTLGKNVDHRTDIYSLGVTIFEMATATLPFREGNLPYHHVHTPPPDAREFNGDLPPLIAAIIARCLEKDPADRFQSAREIVEELKVGLKDPERSAGTLS